MLITPPATVGFCRIDPKHFWIDMGLSETIKERKPFVPKSIKNNLELTRPGQAFKKNTAK